MRLSHMAATAQLKKAFRCGGNVAFGVMGGGVGTTEKVPVKLLKFGPFVAATTAWDAANVRADFHGADGLQGGEVFRVRGAAVFVEEDGFVEGDIVADVKLRGIRGDVLMKRSEGVDQGNAVAAGSRGGDAVDGGGFRRDGEAFRIYYVVAKGFLGGVAIVEGPTDGDNAGGGGNPGGFGVEDEIHATVRYWRGRPIARV